VQDHKSVQLWCVAYPIVVYKTKYNYYYNKHSIIPQKCWSLTLQSITEIRVLKYLSVPHLLYQSIFIVLLNMNTLAEVKLWCTPVSRMPEHWARFITLKRACAHASARFGTLPHARLTLRYANDTLDLCTSTLMNFLPHNQVYYACGCDMKRFFIYIKAI